MDAPPRRTLARETSCLPPAVARTFAIRRARAPHGWPCRHARRRRGRQRARQARRRRTADEVQHDRRQPPRSSWKRDRLAERHIASCWARQPWVWKDPRVARQSRGRPPGPRPRDQLSIWPVALRSRRETHCATSTRATTTEARKTTWSAVGVTVGGVGAPVAALFRWSVAARDGIPLGARHRRGVLVGAPDQVAGEITFPRPCVWHLHRRLPVEGRQEGAASSIWDAFTHPRQVRSARPATLRRTTTTGSNRTCTSWRR